MAATFKPLVISKIADKSEGRRETRFLARNVKVDENGNALIDPDQVQKILYNPDNDRIEEEQWPLAGIQVEGTAPSRTRLPASFIERGRREGWIAITGEKIEHEPGGPPDAEWTVTHTFIQLGTITFKTVDGDVKYKVSKQPGIYNDSDEPSGKRVDWFYECELED